MLYFTESGWTLPDIMDVAEKFDEECDSDEYESKIAKLIEHAAKRAQKENPEDFTDWWSAIRILKKEDHYILVMIGQAGIRPPGDSLKLLGAGCLSAVVIFAVIFLSLSMPESYAKAIGRFIPSREVLRFYFWVACGSVVLVYLGFWAICGKAKANEAIASLIARVFRVPTGK